MARTIPAVARTKRRVLRGFGVLWASAAIVCAAVLPLHAEATPPPVRLYAIDCGRLDYPDMDGFSDTDADAGQSGSLIVSCFLVRHGTDWLLWDTGVGDRIASLPNGEVENEGPLQGPSRRPGPG